jgi:hypothetical protein
MPTAKSYQNLKLLSEPFGRNGKMYIIVETKSGSPKEVRWYSNLEYAKMYPEEAKKVVNSDPYYKPQKYTLGFDKGYITIFKGITEDNEEYFMNLAVFRFARYWGWYVRSVDEVPTDLPAGVECVRLEWDPMGNEDEWLKDEKTVLAHVKATLNGTNNIGKTSKPQGNIGDRFDRVLTVENVDTEHNARYNTDTHTHLMVDPDGNYYIWKTAAKFWEVGTTRTVRGTVKEHTDDGITVLTRCAEQ